MPVFNHVTTAPGLKHAWRNLEIPLCFLRIFDMITAGFGIRKFPKITPAVKSSFWPGLDWATKIRSSFFEQWSAEGKNCWRQDDRQHLPQYPAPGQSKFSTYSSHMTDSFFVFPLSATGPIFESKAPFFMVLATERHLTGSLPVACALPALDRFTRITQEAFVNKKISHFAVTHSCEKKPTFFSRWLLWQLETHFWALNGTVASTLCIQEEKAIHYSSITINKLVT